MEEQIEKENSLNQPGEETPQETSGEETPKEEVSEENKEEQETPENPEETSSDLEEKNRRLYARAKKAEEELKSLKKKLEKMEKRASGSSDTLDVFDLAKTVSSLKDYSPEELDYIQLIAKAKGISPEEAAKTEEATLYISARRQKVEAEKKTPEPSTKQSISEKPVEKITSEDLAKMSVKEKEEYLEKIGWHKKPQG